VLGCVDYRVPVLVLYESCSLLPSLWIVLSYNFILEMLLHPGSLQVPLSIRGVLQIDWSISLLTPCVLVILLDRIGIVYVIVLLLTIDYVLSGLPLFPFLHYFWAIFLLVVKSCLTLSISWCSIVIFGDLLFMYGPFLYRVGYVILRRYPMHLLICHPFVRFWLLI
jgi:hypothetical protein